MVAFTIGMCVVPYYAGNLVMAGTSMSTEQGTSLEQQLRARQTLEHKVRLVLITSAGLCMFLPVIHVFGGRTQTCHCVR